jgi:hypothetical protein
MNVLHPSTMADVAYTFFKDEVLAQKDCVIKQLQGVYRTGKVEQTQFMGALGAICALDDLLETLENKIKTVNNRRKDRFTGDGQ